MFPSVKQEVSKLTESGNLCDKFSRNFIHGWFPGRVDKEIGYRCLGVGEEHYSVNIVAKTLKVYGRFTGSCKRPYAKI